MSNGLLNASGLTTPKVTTEEIILRGKPISDAINGSGEFRITAPHALGDFYFSITSHMPEGVLPLNGSEVSRVTYSDLYNYVLNIHSELAESDKKFIVSEEEWQNISIENNGYVPYYSYGAADGMFRLPRMSGYLKATGELNEAGNYIAEGLPEIEGSASFAVGAGMGTDDNPTRIITDGSSNISYKTLGTTFSIKGELYGKSEHVTPETNTLFVGVWALTAFTQVGTANLAEIKEILSQCETILGDSLPLLSSRYDNRGLETSAWKLSDGSWLDGRIYTEAYDKLIEKIAEGNSQYLEMKESELLSPIEFPESYLVDTENVKFRLPLFVVNERTIIKEWREGTEWYRIWSDGYLEQGGLRATSVGEGKGWIPLSFHIPFNNVDYNILLQAIESDDNLNLNAAGLRNKTNTTVLIANAYNGTGFSDYGIYWRTEGYTEIPPREEWEIDFNYYFKVSHGVDEGRINIEEKLTEFEETAYTRLDEVVEEVSKDYVVHVDKQVGELYFSFDNYCPDGVIPLDGRLVSRATYADLWEWVQEKGLVKDDTLITTNDENAVSIFNEDGTIRYCQWYGSGDGELTFRVPKINGYIKASGDNSLIGQYIAEGLPNVIGIIDEAYSGYGNWKGSGAFTITNGSSSGVRGGGGGSPANCDITFDASQYNSIYGNSEHVTPETNTLFVGVWAITASKAAVFDMRDVEEALKSAESYLMNNVPLMSSRWDRDGLGNLGWVKADGSWIDGRTYTGAYNYCIEKLVSGHEDFIDGQVAAIGEENFDKFIIDRINKRFRLPISNGQRTWEEVQGLNNPVWVLYWKLAHEFYTPAQAEIQEKLDLIDNLVAKTDINLPTLSSRWDNVYAENIGWVKSEGQWLNGNVYRDAYDLMVSRIGINDKFVAVTEGTELTDENADKFLIDTAAVKFRLPLINGERTLVSSFKEDAQWYNLYSDGWLEQGGYIETISGGKTILSFVRPFLDTKYTIVGHIANVSHKPTFKERTVSSIKVYNGITNITYEGTTDLDWTVCGHTNIPDISNYNCDNYLFFKLADEVPSTVVDTQQVISDLKTECDQFRQTLETLMSQGHFVIESNVSEDGNSWWRKYSDGWIEQGGRAYANNHVTVILPTPFSNTNYTTVNATENQDDGGRVSLYGHKTTSFNATAHEHGATGNSYFRWYACGY